MTGGEEIKTELTWIEGIITVPGGSASTGSRSSSPSAGGAALDAVGLAAATAHRGVRHFRVPTTVLAQNDSGLGVKNAVNLKGYSTLSAASRRPGRC